MKTLAILVITCALIYIPGVMPEPAVVKIPEPFKKCMRGSWV